MLSYLLLFNKRLEFDFFNAIQNSLVHEPSKLVEIWSICILPQRKT